MNILVINSGSSSLKYKIISMPSEDVICEGLIERIGLENSNFIYNPTNGKEIKVTEKIKNHKDGLSLLVRYLLDEKVGVLKSTDAIQAVGHRVVHGGSSFSKTRVITSEVKEKIKELFALAPLHNPPNLVGIEVCEELFSKASQIAVFDTAFHQTIPPKAYKYALPNEITEKHKIRVYGFHGTSHKYVSEKAIDYIGGSKNKLITLHLGNGASASAIVDGVCIDTSLGFSPTTGLVMGTRTGDIDPSVVLYLIDELGYSTAEVSAILNKKSGMLGLTGFSDFRDIFERSEAGNRECIEALELYVYRVKKYIGSYVAAMNGLDALVFTAGAGENSIKLRAMICEGLEYLGVGLDEELNSQRPTVLTEINKVNSKVKILIIPTNEELEIAKQTYNIS